MANAVLYGFWQLKDVFAERLATIGSEVIARAIQDSVDEHNRQIDAMLGLFAQRTTNYTVRYKQVAAHRLQPLDEFGRARPVKPAGFYDVAFPIRDAGSAWGANYKALAKMTVDDANRVTAEMLKADMIWMRDQMFAALFASATYSFIDPQFATLTIQPIANGDSVTYLRNGATAAATDTHQLATASAIADATDPFPALYDEIAEHPENAGEVVALIPTNLKTAVMGLAAFRPIVDPNVQAGANTAQLTGTLGTAVPGVLFGYHTAKVWLVEWKALPNDYVIATTTDADPALALREEPEAELKGFRQVAERNDHPFYERQWLRSAGFGAWNRVGAAVERFGNASYAVPTGYTPPIP